MHEYRVIWCIDIKAETPEDAAIKAHELQAATDSIATVYSVRLRNAPDAKPVIVDTKNEIVGLH